MAIAQTESLATVIETNQVNLYRFFSNLPSAELRDSDDIFWLLTDIPSMYYNAVLKTNTSISKIDGLIESSIVHFKERDTPNVRWWVNPSAKPAKLGEYLEKHGLTYIVDVPGMAIDLDDLPKKERHLSDIQIMSATNTSKLKQLVETTSRGFESDHRTDRFNFTAYKTLGYGKRSHLRHFLALKEGKPVGVASLFIWNHVAGIYNVATLPEARGKGVGTALTLHALFKAKKAGCSIGTLQSSPAGLNVYKAIGFQEYCTYLMFKWSNQS